MRGQFSGLVQNLHTIIIKTLQTQSKPKQNKNRIYNIYTFFSNSVSTVLTEGWAIWQQRSREELSVFTTFSISRVIWLLWRCFKPMSKVFFFFLIMYIFPPWCDKLKQRFIYLDVTNVTLYWQNRKLIHIAQLIYSFITRNQTNMEPEQGLNFSNEK